MKLKLVNLSKTETGMVSLPKQFEEQIRPDLIKRAVLSIQSANRQAYGAHPEAGKRASAELSRRRRKYRGSYGIGISRVTRKILSRRGTRMNWVGAVAPGTVGGRRAHPPKAEKVWESKINTKEKRKAIRSALAASISADFVKQRGHIITKEYPFIVEDLLEGITRTAELKKTLAKLGFKEELERVACPATRAGKGKYRGRAKKYKKGMLIVVSRDCPVMAAAANLAGVDILRVDTLNAEALAPGTHPGRMTIFTAGSISRLDAEGLFLQEMRKPIKQATEITIPEKPSKEKKAVKTKEKAVKRKK